MNAKETTVLVLMLAVFCLGPRAAKAGNSLTFTNSYADKLVTIDGMPGVVTSGSGTMNITLPLSGVDISTFDGTTMFNLNMGPSFNLNLVLSDDPAYKPGNKSATFKDTNDSGTVIGTLKVSWTAIAITVTGTASWDFYGAESAYGQAQAGMAGTTPISDVIDVNLSLGDFSYDNPIVIVTGKNTDKEVTGSDGNVYPLESGSISGAADFTPPVVTVTSPAAHAQTTTGLIPVLSGKATDNAGLAGVWVAVDYDFADAIPLAGPFDPSAPVKSASWGLTNLDLSQVPMPIGPGTNVLQFYAIDLSSNVSAYVERDVFWAQPTTLALQTNGPGGISGLKNNQTVNIGQGYSVTAKPAAGYILESWTDSQGDILSENATFTYIVEPDGVLNANFILNPYAALKGTYTGLFYDPENGPTPTNAGYITVTLTAQGGYTGRLYLGTANYAIFGQMQLPADYEEGDSTSFAESLVKQGSQPPLNVQLVLNTDTNLADPGAGSLTGSVTAYLDQAETMTNWTTVISAQLSQYATNTAAPGLYNLQLPPVGGDAAAAPGGNGYGSATLSAKGAVALVLNLADGTSPAVSFSSAVAADGSFPFFASLYSGKGVILGWLTFTNDPITPADLEGDRLAWIKLPTTGKFYTNGFSTIGQGPLATGSRYVAPKVGTNIFGSTNLTITLSDGDVGNVAVNATVAFNPQKNTLTVQAPNTNKVTVSLKASTGVVSGSFVPGPGAKAIAFNGALLPAAGEGFGFFAGTRQDTGSFTIGSAVAPSANGSVISFSDTYAEQLEVDHDTNDPSFGSLLVVETASAKFQIVLPLNITDTSTFDGATPFNVNIGSMSEFWLLRYDPDYAPGKTTATFHNSDPNTGKPIDTFVVSWTSGSITITGSASYDLFDAAMNYGPLLEGSTTVISDIYDVSVSLGDFSYDNPYVIVSGWNTDKEVTGSDGNPYSLDSGRISGAADFTPPVVTVTSPAVNFQTTSGVIPLLAGHASDNAGLAGVWVAVDSDFADAILLAGPFDPNAAVKATSWGLTNLDLSQVPMPIGPGTNVLQFYAIDTSSNVSAYVERDVFWVQTTTLGLQTNGPGGITGLKNNQTVNIGQGYSVTAKPAAGYVLESWTDSQGNILSENATFNYIVEQDGVLIATFIPNPYPAFIGTYTGLYYDQYDQNGGATPTNAGYVTLAITTQGGYSGKLSLGASNYSVSGQFQFPADYGTGDTAVSADSPVIQGGKLLLDVQLSLNTDTNVADPGTGFIYGLVTGYDTNSGNALWSAPLTAERSQYVASTGAPGLYNLEITPVDYDSTLGPGGFGYGSATLSAGGAVTLVVNLADGTSPAVSFSSSVAADGSFPFFFSLYGGNGVFLGWLTFTNDTALPADLEGNNLAWVKLPTGSKFYTNGFSSVNQPIYVTGSRYAAPTAGTNYFGATNLTIALYDGYNIAINDDVTFNPQNNTFAAPSPNSDQVTLSLNTTNGLLTGSFVPGAGAKAIKFSGDLLPTGAYGYGFFLGTNQNTGSFSVGVQQPVFPPPPAQYFLP